MPCHLTRQKLSFLFIATVDISLQARLHRRQLYRQNMGLLLLLLYLTSNALALETDGGFEKFCKSEWLDSSVLEPATRYTKSPTPLGKAKCKQIYKIGANFNGDDICKELSSFPVDEKEISKEKQELTCVWESQAICEDDSILVGSFCFGKFGNCPYGWKLATTRNSDVVQFISKYYPDDELLKVAKLKKYAGVYHSGVIHRNTSGFNLTGPMAVILKRHSASGVYPSEHVIIHDEMRESRISSLCQKKATNLGEETDEDDPPAIFGEGDATNYGQAATAYKPLCANEGEFCMKPSRNLFQPKIHGQIVSLGGYHDYCAGICKDCFAASDYHYKKSFKQGPLPGGRYYVPIGRTKTVQPSDDCGTTPNPDSYMTFVQQRHLQDKNFNGSSRKIWRAGYPANKCSDSGRQAAQFVQPQSQAEGVVDAPVFDRTAVYCVKGPNPPPPEVPSCLRNSYYDQGAEKCKCKTNFNDALDSTDDKIRKRVEAADYQRGYVCLMDLNHKNPTFMTMDQTFYTEEVIFVIDASGSIDGYEWADLMAFLRNAKTWLPKDQRIFFCRYGYIPCSAAPLLPKQWSDNMFDDAVRQVEIGKQDGDSTFTYTALNMTVEIWKQHRSGQSSKALLLLITDGWAYDMHDVGSSSEFHSGVPIWTDGDFNKRRGAVTAARQNNLKIKAVTIGADYLPMKMDVEDENKDIIRVNEFKNLSEEIVKVIMTEVCYHDDQHVNDAMQPE